MRKLTKSHVMRKRLYYRTHKLEALLMSIFAHPSTDEEVKQRIKAEFDRYHGLSQTIPSIGELSA